MPYRIDRIDFTEATHCALCARHPRPLTSGMAYIVVDEHGVEHAAGPTCARRKTTNGSAKPPDFTRGSFDRPEEVGQADEDADNSGHPNQGRRGPAVTQSDHDRAVEYVRLRAEKLASIPQVQYKTITAYYHRWQQSPDHQLEDDIVRRILTIIEAIPQRYPYLGMQRLQTVYAFDFWLSWFLAAQQRTFIVSLRTQLRTNLRLTPTQIAMANTIFAENAHAVPVRLPRLDPQAFA